MLSKISDECNGICFVILFGLIFRILFFVLIIVNIPLNFVFYYIGWTAIIIFLIPFYLIYIFPLLISYLFTCCCKCCQGPNEEKEEINYSYYCNKNKKPLVFTLFIIIFSLISSFFIYLFRKDIQMIFKKIK